MRSIRSKRVVDQSMTFSSLFSIASDAKKCRAYGRGLQPKGVRTGDVAEFRVVTKDAGEGVMKATVTGPGMNRRLLSLVSRTTIIGTSRWYGDSLPCDQKQ